MDAIATLARALMAEGKLPEARKAVDRGKALPAQDESIRLKLAIMEAALLGHEGKSAEAEKILSDAMQKATLRGWKRTDLEARLVKAEMESKPNAAASSKQFAKRLQSDASAAGFALIGRKAGAFAK